MKEAWMDLFRQENQIAEVLEVNRITEKYGLALTKEDAEVILSERSISLKEQRRIEFGASIISRIILEFCDSAYIDRNTLREVILS